MSQRSRFMVKAAVGKGNSSEPDLTSVKRTSVMKRENHKKLKANQCISKEKPVKSCPLSDLSNLPVRQAVDESRVSVPIPHETSSIFSDKSSQIMDSIAFLDKAFPKTSKKNVSNALTNENLPKPTPEDFQMLQTIISNESFDKKLDEIIFSDPTTSVINVTDTINASTSGLVLHDDSEQSDNGQGTSFVGGIKTDPKIQSNLSVPISILDKEPGINPLPASINIPNKALGNNSLLVLSSTPYELPDNDSFLGVSGTSNEAPSNESLSAANSSEGPVASSTPNEDVSNNSVPSTETKKPLHKILQASTDGQRILSYFKLNSKLNSSKRHLLCSVLIQNEMKDDPNTKLQAKDFHRLSTLILDYFPKEKKETYYVPFIPKTANRKMKLASGKLWNKYTNLCKYLRDDGLRNFQNKYEVEALPSIVYDLDGLNTTEYNDAIDWLGKSTTPWQTVIVKWRLTAAGRLALLDKSEVSIDDYFSEFPALNVAEAGDLILIDFSVKFPGFEQTFIDKWPTLVFSILQYVGEKAKEDRSFAKSIATQHLPSAYDDEEVKTNLKKWNLLALRLLLHIIPLRSVPARKKKTQDPDEQTDQTIGAESVRLSKIEVANRFFMIIPSSTTFVTDIKKRIDEYTQSKKRCQTFIILVGEEPDYSYFVFFQNILYTAEDLVSAIDLSFKIYMVLNASFPPENLLVWLFIQEFIYKLHTEHDEVYLSSLTTLAADLELV